MTLLTDLMWLFLGSCCLGWCWVVLRPRIGNDLEVIAEAWLRHRRRTAIDRLARRSRQEVARG